VLQGNAGGLDCAKAAKSGGAHRWWPRGKCLEVDLVAQHGRWFSSSFS